MTKARFDTEQPHVKVVEQDGMYYITICLNGEWKEEVSAFDGEVERYWECDFNHVVTDDIDVEDVEDHPEEYIDYVVIRVDPAEQLRADVDYLLLLAE